VLLFQDLAIMPVLLIRRCWRSRRRVLSWRAGADADRGSVRRDGRAPPAKPVLRAVAQTRTQEAFTAATLLVVIGTALLFESAGLSMAMGAFIAGVCLPTANIATNRKPTSNPSRPPVGFSSSP
jgi:hypothetical protein